MRADGSPTKNHYYAPKHKASEKTLIDRIGDLCLEFPRYGHRRITKKLHREGWIVNHKNVARIMRENKWSCLPRRKSWVATTDSNHGLSIYPNLITDLTPSNVNQLWVADITYIRIFACFVYLALILDAVSRKAIGYALSKRSDTRLALGALHMAISDRYPEPGCIHHSDRGVQYASGEYVKELTCYNFQISMSRKGNPYAESFIKTLKSKEVELWEYRTMEDVQESITYFTRMCITRNAYIPLLAIGLLVSLKLCEW